MPMVQPSKRAIHWGELSRRSMKGRFAVVLVLNLLLMTTGGIGLASADDDQPAWRSTGIDPSLWSDGPLEEDTPMNETYQGNPIFVIQVSYVPSFGEDRISGNIILELFEQRAPITTANMIKNIDFIINENLYLPNYLPARLRYTDIDVCLLSKSDQFIDSYSTLGYFENISQQSLEIVKLKSKYKENKQILLISNNDCLTIKKELIPNKSVNDLVVKNINVNQIGKIIIDNEKVLTIQKGRPYFFPNCQADESQKTKTSKYKLISEAHLPFKNSLQTSRHISLNYYDVTKKSFNKQIITNSFNSKAYTASKIELPKMLIKKSGNLYTSSIPIFIENFSIKCPKDFKNSSLGITARKKSPWIKKRRNNYSVLMKKSDLILNNFKTDSLVIPELTRVQFCGYPFSKSIDIHSITEDYFEQEVNSVFCKNTEFIEAGKQRSTGSYPHLPRHLRKNHVSRHCWKNC